MMILVELRADSQEVLQQSAAGAGPKKVRIPDWRQRHA